MSSASRLISHPPENEVWTARRSRYLSRCRRVTLHADDLISHSAYIQGVSLQQRVLDAARSLDSRLIDAALALGLTLWAIAAPGVLSEPGAFTIWWLAAPGAFDDPSRAVVLVAMTAAIAWRRRAPVTVLGVEVLGVLLVPRYLNLPQGIAILIAAYTAALYSSRRLTVIALLVLASAWIWAFGGRAQIPGGLVPVLLVAPVFLAGTAIRRREQRAVASAARADRLEREREAALRAERARIARELHDLVTHSVSVMVLQTGAAREIMSQDQTRSRALLESVESSGRSALEELRHMLGLLSDQDGEAPLSPQPRVDDVPALIEQVQQAGLAVELHVDGQPRQVSGGVALAAYRIVQEALTNVIKHADGAPSQVTLRWSDAALELLITDEGPPQNGSHPPDVQAARGITGMRERAAMYGGTLDASPGSHGGYTVRARIPLEHQGT